MEQRCEWPVISIAERNLLKATLTLDHSAEKAQLSIQKAFASFSLAEYKARVVTIHVDTPNRWKDADVSNVENGITLLWESENIHNHVLHNARERLRKPRIIADVCRPCF